MDKHIIIYNNNLLISYLFADSQQLLLNSGIPEESFQSLQQPQQEMLNNILDDVDSGEPFQENIADDENAEIVLPLEVSIL